VHTLFNQPQGVFRNMVWLLDGIGALQLDGEPVWLHTVIAEPNHPAVVKALHYQNLANQLTRVITCKVPCQPGKGLFLMRPVMPTV